MGDGGMLLPGTGRGGRVTTLLESPEGVARDLEVHFGGRESLFAMRRNQADNYVGRPTIRPSRGPLPDPVAPPQGAVSVPGFAPRRSR